MIEANSPKNSYFFLFTIMLLGRLDTRVPFKRDQMTKELNILRFQTLNCSLE